MKEMRTSYQELLSLTQLFLLREYPLQKKSSPLLINKEEEKSTPTPLPPLPPSVKPISPFPSNSLVSPSPSPSPSPILPKPVTTQEKKEEGKLKKWELDPLKDSISSLDIEEFWTSFPTLFPHMRLLKSIPDDNEARKIKNHWLKEQEIAILILSFGEEEKASNFLKKMAQGISERLAPARILSVSQVKKEEDWQQIFAAPSLRLIITTDYALYMHPQLMRDYREQPQQRKHFLFNKPLLLLSDPSLYLKEPQLKALLWRTICNEFASTSPSL